MNLRPHSIHIIIFVSMFLMIPTNDAHAYTSTFGAETDFYIVMTIPIVFNSLNFLGALYIVYRTHLQWRFDYKRISLSFRFPFYIAITDLLYSSSILIVYVTAFSKKSEFLIHETITSWSYPFCEIVGFFIIYFVFLNLLLVGAMSIITWLRVVRLYHFELGRYDCKIWSPILFITSTITLSTINVYGPRGYACGTKVEYDIVGIIFFALIIASLLTIVYCYASVLITIRRVKEDNSSVTSSDNFVKLTNIERKTFNKVLTYVLVFIIQYVPILIFNTLGFLRIHHIIGDAIASAVLSFGGIGNLIQYLFNEGIKPPSSIKKNSLNGRLKADEHHSHNTNDTNITNYTNDSIINELNEF